MDKLTTAKLDEWRAKSRRTVYRCANCNNLSIAVGELIAEVGRLQAEYKSVWNELWELKADITSSKTLVVVARARVKLDEAEARATRAEGDREHMRLVCRAQLARARELYIEHLSRAYESLAGELVPRDNWVKQYDAELAKVAGGD